MGNSDGVGRAGAGASRVGASGTGAAIAVPGGVAVGVGPDFDGGVGAAGRSILRSILGSMLEAELYPSMCGIMADKYSADFLAILSWAAVTDDGRGKTRTER